MAIISSLVFASLGTMAILTQPPTTAYAQQEQQSQAFTAKLR
jgi:hypothetical protein